VFYATKNETKNQRYNRNNNNSNNMLLGWDSFWVFILGLHQMIIQIIIAAVITGIIIKFLNDTR